MLGYEFIICAHGHTELAGALLLDQQQLRGVEVHVEFVERDG